MMVTRRNVIKAMGGSMAAVLLGGFLVGKLGVLFPPAQTYAQQSATRMKFGMVIDTRACIGCRRCSYACKRENNIGRNSDIFWIAVLAMKHGSIGINDAELNYQEAPLADRWYLPVQCMQCENPPCVSVCPVKATWKGADGIVVIDYNRCIGCRYCMAACPYWARHFNAKEPSVPLEEINPRGGTYQESTHQEPIRPMGVVEKCTFCAHRVREGLMPRCVEVCPVGARYFGDLNDPDSVVSKMLRSRRTFRLKEELNTEPKIYYVG